MQNWLFFLWKSFISMSLQLSLQFFRSQGSKSKISTTLHSARTCEFFFNHDFHTFNLSCRCGFLLKKAVREILESFFFFINETTFMHIWSKGGPSAALGTSIISKWPGSIQSWRFRVDVRCSFLEENFSSSVDFKPFKWNHHGVNVPGCHSLPQSQPFQ